MSASDDVPYFSRFVVKFLEIFAAGLATAVSGYLIAHLAGALSSSTPATVGTAVQVPASTGAGAVSSTQPAKLPAPASAGANEQHPAAVQEANAPAVAQPAQGADPSHEPSHADATKAAVARKRPEADAHSETDAGAAASATEGKRDHEENKHAQDSVLARIRAALANSNAKRGNPPDTPQPSGNGARTSAAMGPPSPPVDKRPSAPPGAPVTSAPPGFVNPPPPPIQQPVQLQVQPPVQQQQPPAGPTPLTTVEIPSRPVATVQTAPAPAPTSQDDTGMFSGLDRLRHDPLAASEDAPRPPMPVGQ
jgi:hypothetical protein